ncbi:type II toxin-antitoxin system VapC family toxin [Leptolyngbya sp. FACHB-261]|uniref:type II toxin-antitoxin system VapC family toxin n=1 Tax=Leptolyngbya sp. FACHB-261 TaxID=2692806 RepID=UPI0016844B88|nr:PIN domain-containing protein [Leptolyngbya sp. FACHB-261]MBD2104323.1 PIN domain-containing protein [Leptolyngbya sp. FACHB-261]
MRILLDTNIVIDLALQRQPYVEESDQIFSLIEQGLIEGYVSASTLSDLYYIIRKQQGHGWTLKFLKRLTSICSIATVDQAIIAMALNIDFRDFEDAIQYSCAVLNQLDAIVTRNQQDFVSSTLRILTPATLIEELANEQNC